MTSHSNDVVEMTEEEIVGLSHSLHKIARVLRNEIENLDNYNNDAIEGFQSYLQDTELNIQLSLMALQGALSTEDEALH